MEWDGRQWSYQSLTNGNETAGPKVSVAELITKIKSYNFSEKRKGRDRTKSGSINVLSPIVGKLSVVAL